MATIQYGGKMRRDAAICAGIFQQLQCRHNACTVAVICRFREGRREDDIDHSRKEMLNGYLHSQLDTLKVLSHHHKK
jgi:hypothetical protein